MRGYPRCREIPSAQRVQHGGDEAVDRVRIGLGVDAQADARGRSRDVTGPIEIDRRLRYRRTARRRRRSSSTVDDDVNVIASTSPARTRARSVGVGRDRNGAVHREHVDRRSPRAVEPLGQHVARGFGAREQHPRAVALGIRETPRATTRRRSARERDRRGRRARASASRVPGPIAATRTPAERAGVEARRGARPRSKNASTPLADVNTSHAYASSVGQREVDRLERDRRQLDHLGAELLEPGAQLARLLARARDDDAPAEQRALLEPAEVERGDRADDDRARRLDPERRRSSRASRGSCAARAACPTAPRRPASLGRAPPAISALRDLARRGPRP